MNVTPVCASRVVEAAIDKGSVIRDYYYGTGVALSTPRVQRRADNLTDERSGR